jgi:hypothetical protein
MAGSILGSFVSGTRQVLVAQLFVSVGAVALAGWTLGVTNELIRERDRLRERVIQLEADMGQRGIVVPETPAVVDTAPPAAEDVYPGEVGLGEQQPTDGAAPADGAFNPGQIVTDLFTPPPPMRTVVLHARSEQDGAYARRLGEQLAQAGNVQVVVNVLPQQRAQQEAGYSYYDGRQSSAAAALVAQFNDVARTNQIAQWSAQLRGTALPEQGEYTADRLDIVLPPLVQQNFDRRALEMRRVEPQFQQQVVPPPPPPPPIQ